MGLKNPLLRFFAPPDNGFHKRGKQNEECGENVDFSPSEIEDKMKKPQQAKKRAKKKCSTRC